MQVLSDFTSFGFLVEDCLTGLVSHNLLTSKFLLVFYMKALSSGLNKLREDFYEIVPKFDKINASKFQKALDEITDVEFAAKLSDCVADLFEKCSNLHEICKQCYFYCLEDSCNQIAEVKFTDSVLQVS